MCACRLRAGPRRSDVSRSRRHHPLALARRWVDEAGHFHALFHIWAHAEVGAHAFSRDGLRWTLAETRAYSTVIETAGGGNVTYGRRERPHLVLDEQRKPTHLLSAVQYGPGMPADFSFTHVQPIARGDESAAVI